MSDQPSQFFGKDRLCLLLVDGTNVMLTIYNLWSENSDGIPQDVSVHAQFEPIAQYLQKRFNIADTNIEKCLFAKQQRDPNGGDTLFKTDRQDSFKHALEDKGWQLAIRAPKTGTEYGDKINDVDDDLLDYAEEFMEMAEPGDVLVIMTNDFSDTPNNNNVNKTLQNARTLGMGALAISFKDLAYNTINSSPSFEIIDSRDIEGVYECIPPRPRSASNIEPGTLAWFSKPTAVTVVDRRPSRLEPVVADPEVLKASRQVPASVPRPPTGLSNKIVIPSPE
jgi:hypothetical protein